jgi:hypothetical protein
MRNFLIARGNKSPCERSIDQSKQVDDVPITSPSKIRHPLLRSWSFRLEGCRGGNRPIRDPFRSLPSAKLSRGPAICLSKPFQRFISTPPPGCPPPAAVLGHCLQFLAGVGCVWRFQGIIPTWYFSLASHSARGRGPARESLSRSFSQLERANSSARLGTQLL